MVNSLVEYALEINNRNLPAYNARVANDDGSPAFARMTDAEIQHWFNVNNAQKVYGEQSVVPKTPEQAWAEGHALRNANFNDAYFGSLNNTLTSTRNQLRAFGVDPNLADQAVYNAYGGVSLDDSVVGHDNTKSVLGRVEGNDYVNQILNPIRAQRRDAAYQQGYGQGLEKLNALGASNLTDRYNREMQSLYQRTPATADTYDSVFDPSGVLDKITGDYRNTQRIQNVQGIESAYSKLGRPEALLADTADDRYISDIVGSAFSDASAAVQRAKARGSLNDQGFQAASAFLGQQNAAANTTAQTLGNAVLTRGRSQLGDIYNNAKTKATSWDFGQTFDPNNFTTDYTKARDQFTSNLGGEISSALAGQKFFDVGEALNKGGYAQGAQNVAPLGSGFQTPALAALQKQRDDVNKATRGLGGTGTF